MKFSICVYFFTMPQLANAASITGYTDASSIVTGICKLNVNNAVTFLSKNLSINLVRLSISHSG